MLNNRQLADTFSLVADLSEIKGEPMPRLSSPLEWSEVEAWLRAQVREMGRERVGLNR